MTLKSELKSVVIKKWKEEEQVVKVENYCMSLLCLTSVRNNLAKGYITILSPLTPANVFVRS